jgi:DNA-binding NarL/FixJ family response regulator
MAGVTGKTRVLIVDDKADIRGIVATRLRIEPGFDVVGEAANGAEAIARVGELKPAIMILDLQMPVMSGEEVIPILRSLAPGLRILVFSAYAGAQQRLRASECPDAEVRKGTGLAPLVKELHLLLERNPADLVRVDLGIVEVGRALRASHEWARLNPTVREVAVETGTHPEFLALVGVFLALGEPLAAAASAGCRTSSMCFTTRLEAGRAARRGLAAVNGSDAALLEPLRSRLLAALPDDPDTAGSERAVS